MKSCDDISVRADYRDSRDSHSAMFILISG